MSAEVSPELHAKRRAGLARIQRLAWWLDDVVRIPGIDRRVGVDGIIGLVPFAGDLVGAGLSSLLVIEAVRLGAPKRVWARMGLNMGLDFVIGLVPVFGDLFDFYWKSNRRTERLMRRWLESATTTETEPRSRWPGALGLTLGLACALTATTVLWRAVFV